MERFEPDIHVGLTDEQVQKRMEEGLFNYDDQPKTKSIKEIFTTNLFTYFNFLNLALGLAVFFAGLFSGELFQGLKNCLFMGVIIINSIISIIEEVISKKILDRLSFLNETSVNAIRNGKKINLTLEELVLDDIVELKSGHQIGADAVVMDGEIEVNEAFLTGEADAIVKKKGDSLLSGSFVVSGKCISKIEHVGKDNYVSSISKEAKYAKKVNSIIMQSFEQLLKILSICIIPIAVLMYFSQLRATGGVVTEAIFTTVAALIGMIPEGLVLLTSSVMAVSVIRLARYKVLVQQLYCIETLARVDVICLDKTGTLTEGKMKVVDFLPFGKVKKEWLKELLCAYTQNTFDENVTMKALQEYFSEPSSYHVQKRISFSSERKFSGLEFQECGSLYLGSFENLLSKKQKIPKNIQDYQEKYRVLVLAQSAKGLSQKPSNLEILGFVLLEDVIRKEAKNTLDYFKKQGVMVKIISGDHVSTVLHIADGVGLPKRKGIDVGSFNDEELIQAVPNYDIYGRVTPKQKKLIIETLQKSGRTVAMTGDGVNDVLAMKASDCAISMASGSEAARNVAELVLLKNNFDSLPKIVEEGRRTINNVERSASLLLGKTMYTILLILFSVLFSTKYFFVPIQLTLITTFTIGTPSFILALEPNHELVKGKFLVKIASRSLPTALTVFFNVVLVTCFSYVFHLSYELQSSICVLLTAITGFIFLYKICKPFTYIRGILFSVMLIGFLYCVLFQYEFFNLVPIRLESLLITFVLSIDSLYVYKKLNYWVTKYFAKIDPTIPIQY